MERRRKGSHKSFDGSTRWRKTKPTSLPESFYRWLFLYRYHNRLIVMFSDQRVTILWEMGDNMVPTIFQHEIILPDALSPSIRAVGPSCIVPTVAGDSSMKISSKYYVNWSSEGSTAIPWWIVGRVTDGLVRKRFLTKSSIFGQKSRVDQACRPFAPSQAHRVNLLLTKPNVTPTKKGYFMTSCWRGLRLVRNSLERVKMLLDTRCAQICKYRFRNHWRKR